MISDQTGHQRHTGQIQRLSSVCERVPVVTHTEDDCGVFNFAVSSQLFLDEKWDPL